MNKETNGRSKQKVVESLIPPDIRILPLYPEDTGSHYERTPIYLPPGQQLAHDIRSFPVYPSELNEDRTEEQEVRNTERENEERPY